MFKLFKNSLIGSEIIAIAICRRNLISHSLLVNFWGFGWPRLFTKSTWSAAPVIVLDRLQSRTASCFQLSVCTLPVRTRRVTPLYNIGIGFFLETSFFLVLAIISQIYMSKGYHMHKAIQFPHHQDPNASCRRRTKAIPQNNGTNLRDSDSHSTTRSGIGLKIKAGFASVNEFCTEIAQGSWRNWSSRNCGRRAWCGDILNAHANHALSFPFYEQARLCFIPQMLSIARFPPRKSYVWQHILKFTYRRKTKIQYLISSLACL